MQSIFAYEQCKDANYHLALDQIGEAFLPDLNSMEVQDKAFLKESAKEATELFKEVFKNHPKEVTTGSTDKINEVVAGAIDGYFSNLERDRKFLKKEMLQDAEQINGRYAWMVYLLDSLSNIFKSIKPKGGIEAYNNFLNNKVAELLLDHPKLSDLYLRSGLSWEDQREELVVWVNEVFVKDESFVNYMNSKNPSFEDDREFLLYFYKSLIFKNEIISLFMEKEDLYWSENKAILRSMVVKTIKAVQEGRSEFDLAELSYNWQEDKAFFETIFDKTILNGEEFEEMIASKTKNWDIERISDTDRILLEMAIQEMINFPGIPLKVTINEYIEVSKKYSTPKSKLFINGVLDVIAVDLQKQGKIKKSGRGLIDNK